MSTVGYDACVNVFTGWESTAGANDGVAIFNTVSKTFDFINLGLPNKNINKFRHDPFMSSISMFACTDSGVYILQNYIVNINEALTKNDNISIFPNPFNDKTTIEIIRDSRDQSVKIDLFNSEGRLVKTILNKSIIPNVEHITLFREDLKSGVYFLRISNSSEMFIKKLVIR
jgi:hypothetical protein